MAAPNIRFNPQQAQDFTIIGALGPERLKSAIDVLDQINRRMMSDSQVRRAFTDVIGEESAGALTRQLISFSIGLRHQAFSSQVVDAVSDALRARNIDAKVLEDWEGIKNLFWDAL